MSSAAVVSVTGKLNEKTSVKLVRSMSSDLPADALGELVVEAINEMYRQGHDPVTYHLVIHFN